MATRRLLSAGAIIFFISAMLVLMPGRDLKAMPSIARKYKTSCVTCHETFPRLNTVGDAFRLNGYRFKDDELYLKDEPLGLGDEAYKKLWPKAMWPGNIPGDSGFSASARFILEVNSGNDSPQRKSDVTFAVPHEIEVSWVGSLAGNISAYGDMIFVQEDFGREETYSWLMVKAWMEFADLLGPEDMFNLRLGTVGMHTIGLYTATNEKRIGLQPYAFNSWFMPWVDAYKSAELKEFWGNTFTFQPQLGFEASGFGQRWLYYAGVVKGNLEKPEGGDPELYEMDDSVFFSGSGRSTSSKDYYAGLGYKIGGLGLDGSGAKDDNLLSNQSEFWRDDSIFLTVFGYRGTAEILVDRWDDSTHTTSTVFESDDDFWRLAAGVKGKYKDLTVTAGYMRGRDDKPFGVLWDNSVDIDAWLGEVHYFFYPWLIPYVRYESVYFNNLPKDKTIQEKQNREIVTIGFKAHIRANVFVNAEYTKFTNDPDYICLTDEMTFIQLVVAF
jgi:hypothetical protein